VGQEIFLRPLSAKITEFKVKNSCKNLEKQNLVFFEGKKPNLVLEMNLTKL